jgi:hypothetical protein
MTNKLLQVILILSPFFSAFGQENTAKKLEVNWLFDGVVVCGYVDNGAYLNFTGPNLSFTKGPSKLVLGMLPSLRFKKDSGTVHNAFVTPSLGCGITYSYKWAAIQIPIYYNSKTATSNGQWNIGVGLGVRINALKTK